jgi:hypothetical protein
MPIIELNELEALDGCDLELLADEAQAPMSVPPGNQ